MVEIYLKPGEQLDTALRRLKDRMEREGTMDEVRRLQSYETPAQKRTRKARILAKKIARARKSRLR